MGHAATSRARVIPEPASSPTDPRFALLQAQYEEVLTAQLAGTGRPATQSPPVPEDDPYVAQMIKLVAGLEEQVRAQKADHLQQVTAEPMLDPEAQRVADLEATIRRLSAELMGTGNSGQAVNKLHESSARMSATTSATKEQGHQGADRSGPAAASEGLGGRQASPLAGTGFATGHFSFDDIFPAKKDISVGEEAFGVSIRMPRNVLYALCPKGMPDATKLQIAEAGLDVASLPGKYRSSAAMDIVDVHQAIANTMGQAMELVQNQQNSQRGRDLSWQSERRNALDSIKNQNQLLSFQEELDETSDEALESSENQMRHVLADLCLEPEVVEYFVNTSQFPTIIRKTLEYYKALVDHVVTLSNKYGFALAQTDLQYYAAKLALRRKGSHSRLEVLLKVYCDLRDGHRNKFIDSSLQQKKNGIFFLQAMTQTVTPRTVGGAPLQGGEAPTQVAQPKTCRRCKSKLHPNLQMCPLYHPEIPPEEAAEMALECQGANNFVAAAKAAVAKHLTAGREEGAPVTAP